MKQVHKLGVIVVHYGSVTETMDMIQSFNGQSYTKFRMYIVDNDPEHPLPKIKKKLLDFPFSVSISNKNLGWAGGVNIGASAAIRDGCDYLTLLTGDLIAYNHEFLSRLIMPLVKNQADVVLPIVVYDTNKDKIWMAGGGVNYRTLHNYHRHANEFLSNITTFEKPDYGGIGITLSVVLFKKVKGVSTDYFLYYEDLDFCKKLKNEGAQFLLSTKATIAHRTSAVAERSNKKMEPLSAYCFGRSGYIFISKYIPDLLGKLLATVGLMVTKIPVFVGGMILQNNLRCIYAFTLGSMDGIAILLGLTTITKTNYHRESFR